MRIEKNDIVIRNAEQKDCKQLAAWWNDGTVMAHAGFPLGLYTDATKVWEMIKNDSDDKRRRLVISFQNKLIGETSYRIREDKTAEIGIKICDPSYQDRGLGRILLSMLIKELFVCGCEKIVLDTNLKNTRAQHVYELLGFQKTGVRENSWQDQLGNWQTAIDYALTPDRFHDYTEENRV